MNPFSILTCKPSLLTSILQILWTFSSLFFSPFKTNEASDSCFLFNHTYLSQEHSKAHTQTTKFWSYDLTSLHYTKIKLLSPLYLAAVSVTSSSSTTLLCFFFPSTSNKSLTGSAQITPEHLYSSTSEKLEASLSSNSSLVSWFHSILKCLKIGGTVHK